MRAALLRQQQRCVPWLPDVMRAVGIRIVGSNGGPEALETFKQVPVPQCKANEILIQVAACGINEQDILQRQGLYHPPPGYSQFPGLEVSGKVVCIGANILLDDDDNDDDNSKQSFKLGDNVMALTNGGGYAEYCSVPHEQVLSVPKNVSLREASCIPEDYIAVYHILHNKLLQNEKLLSLSNSNLFVLVHNGSSGIGTTAIQMSKLAGFNVLSTAESSEKCNLIKELGAYAINHHHQDYKKVIWEQTREAGVDYTFLLNDIIKSGMCGYSTKNGKNNVVGEVVRKKNKEVKAQIAKGLVDRIFPHLESGQIKVVLDKQLQVQDFDFDSISDAHRLMEDFLNQSGKIYAIVNKNLC